MSILIYCRGNFASFDFIQYRINQKSVRYDKYETKDDSL